MNTTGRAAIIAATLVSLVACSSGPSPTPSDSSSAQTVSSPAATPLADLHRLALPGGLHPTTLVATDQSLIIAGHDGETQAGRTPGMAIISSSAARAVPLTPNSPYAKVADIFSVAVDGSRLEALGRASGGAHSNPRWTTWRGSATSLVERPQVFWTFGGEDAGGLTAIVATPNGPRIVGSWQGRTALDIAIWRPDGGDWARMDSAGTPLANTATLQVTGRAAAAMPRGMIIAGSTFDLSGGVRQGAAVWLSTGDRTWTLVPLPDGGRRSQALSVSCAGESCSVAGYVDGSLAVWSVDGSSGTTQRATGLPAVPIDLDGPRPQVIAAGAEPMVAYSSAGTTSLLARTASGWATYGGPAGDLDGAAGLDGRIYLATSSDQDDSTLWSAASPA